MYVGKVRYKDETHEGEHEGIVDAEVFRRTQAALKRNGRDGGREVRNKHGALLRGLLRCDACDCAMAHSFSCKGHRRYRYYVCTRAQQRGWQECPAPSVPAGEIERFVVEQIKGMVRDPALVAATLAETRRLAEEATGRLRREKAALERQRRGDEAELRRLGSAPATNGRLAALVEVQERIDLAGRQLAELEDELASATAGDMDDADIEASLADFDAVWESLSSSEQERILELLIERVSHDGRQGKVSITFRPTGIKMLAAQLTQYEEALA